MKTRIPLRKKHQSAVTRHELEQLRKAIDKTGIRLSDLEKHFGGIIESCASTGSFCFNGCTNGCNHCTSCVMFCPTCSINYQPIDRGLPLAKKARPLIQRKGTR